MKSPTLAVQILDSVHDPDGGGEKILKKADKSNGYDLYRVFVYLDGFDLPLVRSVVYQLHSSFKDSRHRINRTPNNPTCKLIIWTWGTFVVRGDVEDLEGRIHKISRQLTWDREVKPDLVEAV
ncbi:MAG: hypothetical protein O2968_16080 [Acidobacteria bacterium]|nr:hypothetical protein [Acidobacteriota bacterium]